MLRCLTNITISQKASPTFPTRNKTLVYAFCNEYEAEDSWAELTNKAKVTLPKNVYIKDASGKLITLKSTNYNLGGFSAQTPIFLKGDSIVIRSGYKYYDKQKNEIIAPQDSSGGLAIVFQGFISSVKSKTVFELECQDNMYVLKQLAAPNKVFQASQYSMETMLAEMLQGTGFTVRKGTITNIGDFRVQNETVAQVLARLHKDYRFPSYFRGNELRCGLQVYIEQDAIDDGVKSFKFEQDIIEDDLIYKRKDDIVLSAIAHSINQNTISGKTKDGQSKTRKGRLEVFIGYQNGKFISITTQPGQTPNYPANTEGERHEFFFWNVSDPNTLISMATEKLKRYYYTGFRGRFTTFGLPLLNMGDNVNLLSSVLPERNGQYKIKSVKRKGGVNGIRQTAELEYLIASLDANGNTTALLQ